MNIIKSIIFIFWFLFSNSIFKQRKVTDVNRMLKWFSVLATLYLCVAGIEYYFAISFMQDLIYDEAVSNHIKNNGGNPDSFFKTSIMYLTIIYVVYIMVYFILVFMFVRLMLQFKLSMELFH